MCSPTSPSLGLEPYISSSLYCSGSCSHSQVHGPSCVCASCFSYTYLDLLSVAPLGESDVSTDLHNLNHPLCVY